MEGAAYEKKLAYSYDIESGISVSADGEALRRIASELITNALKYETEGGSVKISLAREKKKAVFTVANEKTVIEKEDMEHIFERFYRSDKSRTGENGHGLGLAIVKNLAASSGGAVRAESEEGKGTLFSVSFPAGN